MYILSFRFICVAFGSISCPWFEPFPTGSFLIGIPGKITAVLCSGLSEEFNICNIASFTLSYFKESLFSFAPEMSCGAGPWHGPIPLCPYVMLFPSSTLLLEARIKSPICLQGLWAAAAKDQSLYIRDKTHLDPSVACGILVCPPQKELVKLRMQGKKDILPLFCFSLLQPQGMALLFL